MSGAADKEDLSDCLIVVPEAFNCRNGYRSGEVDFSMKESLPDVTRSFSVALVAGLIEDSNSGRFSSAYLIDGHVFHLLTQKLENDGYGALVYEPRTPAYDCPLLHRGIIVGALICMDAANFCNPARERHQALLNGLDKRGRSDKVLCVPARMGTYSSQAIAQEWPRSLSFILANAEYNVPSVIRLAGHSNVDVECTDRCNRVQLLNLA